MRLGTNKYEEAGSYIQTKSEDLSKCKNTKVTCTDLTCTTNTKNMQLVFDAFTIFIIRTI